MDYDYGSSTGTAFAAIWLFFLAIIVIEVVVLVGYYVLLSLGLQRFFRKVGVEPWIAWVPIYNSWKWLEVGGFAGALVFLSFVPGASIVVAIFLYIGMYRTGLAFGKDAGFLVLGIFFPFVWAFMLGADDQVYRPEVLAQHGYPPPRAGFGSVQPGAYGQYPPNAYGQYPQSGYEQYPPSASGQYPPTTPPAPPAA